MNNDVMLIKSVDLIDISISVDKLTGFIKLMRNSEGENIFTKDQFVTALKEHKIIFGINMNTLEKLAARPVYNIPIKVAEGREPINGDDGWVKLLVKKDAEYRPVYNEAEQMDYKNLECFQYAKKGQILAEIIKEEDGISGRDVLGGVIFASKGKKPLMPIGKNTQVNQDGTKIIAECSGIIKFVNLIHINEMLQIAGDVDFSTGNIDFSGDVTINGNVSSGFSVISGGDLIIKGVVEDAKIKAAGNVIIGQGICSGGAAVVQAEKNLKCNFIENAMVEVGGDLTTDYIINGKIICMENIYLSGSREAIIGGEVSLKGDLIARVIGHDSECSTVIKMQKKRVIDKSEMEKLLIKQEEINKRLTSAYIKDKELTKLLLVQEKLNILNRCRENPTMEKIYKVKREVNEKIYLLQSERDGVEKSMRLIEEEGYDKYCGSIVAKHKICFGAKIFFGDIPFPFQVDSLESCRIFWDQDHIESDRV